MTTHLLAIGTVKGLFLAHSQDRRSWQLTDPMFVMNAVYAVAVDPRNQRLLV